MGLILLSVITLTLVAHAQPAFDRVVSPGKGSHEGNSVIEDAEGFVYLTGQHQTAAFVD